MSPVVATSQRLSRLLAMLPWLVSEGGAYLHEVAERFGTTTEQAARDLELASMVGVPPYGPGDLLELLFGEDGWVSARPGPVFDRPPRLSPAEAFALVAAGRAILAVPGADTGGPLATALAKVERALGERGALAIELTSPPLLDLVRDAVSHRRRLRVAYWSAWRDKMSQREIDPYLVHAERGRWHVKAFDHSRREVRTFRVDRMESAEPTGEVFDPPASLPGPSAYEPGPDATTVTLDLPASARWVVETYPCEWHSEAGGRMTVTISVSGTAWLERLLLRVGPEGRLVAPEELAGTAASAARRLLAAYDAHADN